MGNGICVVPGRLLARAVVILAVAFSFVGSTSAFGQQGSCPETVSIQGQSVSIGEDIRRAGGPGPALRKIEQMEREFRAQNGDCSKFRGSPSSYQACRVYLDGISNAKNAIRACAMAQMQRNMQQQMANVATKPPSSGSGLPSIDSVANEAGIRSDAAALRNTLDGMDTRGAVADAAAALDALQQQGVKDPSTDYRGQACAYFTQPMERPSGSGLNVYADGSMVCYGERMYQCVNRRWLNMGQCDLYAGWQRRTAEVLERDTAISAGNPPYDPNTTDAVKGQHQQSDFAALRDQIKNAKTEAELRAAAASLQAYNHHWGVRPGQRKQPTDITGALDVGTTVMDITETLPGVGNAIEYGTAVLGGISTPTATDLQVREQRLQQVNDEFLRRVQEIRGIQALPPIR